MLLLLKLKLVAILDIWLQNAFIEEVIINIGLISPCPQKKSVQSFRIEIILKLKLQ